MTASHVTKRNPRQRSLALDLLIYLPAQALPALAAFITVPIYTRLFAPDKFGDYALASSTVELLLLAAVTGFGQAAVRFFSVYRLQGRLPSYFAALFGSVACTAGVAAVLGAGVLLALRPTMPADLYSLLWAGLALFVVNAGFATLMDVLRSEEKGRWYTAFSIAQAFGSIILGLLFVLVLHTGIVGLIWGQALAMLLAVVPLVRLTTVGSGATVRARPTVRWSDLKPLWAFALPFVVGNLAYWTLSASDRYLIEAFRGSHEVGLYAVANKVSWRTIQLLVYLFFLVPAPIASRVWEERGRQAAEEVLTSFTRMFFLMIIPAVAGLAVVAAPLVRLLADEAYFTGYRAIWLVAVGSMGLGLTNLGLIGCMVTNNTRYIARNQLIAAGASVLLNLLLVPAFGFIGAAVTAAVSFSLLAGLQARSSARFLTWRWPFRSLWHVLAASAAMCAAVLLVQALVAQGESASAGTLRNAVSLALSVAVGGAVYGGVLWALGEVSPKELLGLFSRQGAVPAAAPVASDAGPQ